MALSWVSRALFFMLMIFCLLSGSCVAPDMSSRQRPLTIAVWPFEDLSAGFGETPALLMTELTDAALLAVQERPGCEIVERSRLEAVLREQYLGSGALADQETRLRLGRLLGARCMLFGTYQRAGGTARIDLRLVDVETSRLVASENRLFSGGLGPDLAEGTKKMVALLLEQAYR